MSRADLNLATQVHDQRRAELCDFLSSMSESLFMDLCSKLRDETGTRDYEGLRANLALFAAHDLGLGRPDIFDYEDEHRKREEVDL